MQITPFYFFALVLFETCLPLLHQHSRTCFENEAEVTWWPITNTFEMASFEKPPKWTRRGTELSNWKDNVPSWSFSAFVNKMGPWLRSSACKGSLNWRDLRWRCLGNDKSQFLKHWESGSEELQTIACKEKGMETNEWDLAGYEQPLFMSWRNLPVKLLEMFSIDVANNTNNPQG